ncbi:dimethylargininase [Scopulibacillus darangshiensis]|uniref:Dimethylargininase n=1 Tax=Scopulibacillus darangshiensis TaxID=442528 RepID=A0A4R2PAB0_9BACL|nr:arginine deiminase family protein [Scopulibacillus darangshiensis]TCP31308.1 dimethylargininase [Scopulibacillus darangshiensis]
MFTHVIVKKLGKSFVNGLTTANLGKPDYDKAVKQHAAYVNALKTCGVEVVELEADECYPDSTFVEDTAIVTEKCAIITNPGAESRNGEIKNMEGVLETFYEELEHIQGSGTLDGGDVLQVNDHFYIGLSDRTNKDGALQLKNILEKYGYKADIVPLKAFFHLKTGIAYLDNQNLVVAGEFVDHELFKGFEKIVVDDDEEYAANCIYVNGNVIIPKGFEKAKEKMIAKGYPVIELEMSEFQKVDGGLSCLSLRMKR